VKGRSAQGRIWQSQYPLLRSPVLLLTCSETWATSRLVT